MATIFINFVFQNLFLFFTVKKLNNKIKWWHVDEQQMKRRNKKNILGYQRNWFGLCGTLIQNSIERERTQNL